MPAPLCFFLVWCGVDLLQVCVLLLYINYKFIPVFSCCFCGALLHLLSFSYAFCGFYNYIPVFCCCFCGASLINIFGVCMCSCVRLNMVFRATAMCGADLLQAGMYRSIYPFVLLFFFFVVFWCTMMAQPERARRSELCI